MLILQTALSDSPAMAPRITPVQQHHPSNSLGFTIVELVISAAIGVVGIGSLSFYTLMEFLNNPTQDVNLQLSDEGERATDGSISRSAVPPDSTKAVIGCTVPTGTSLVVSMRVPGAAIP